VIEPGDWEAQHKTQGRHLSTQQQRRAEYAQAEWISEEMNVLADTPKGTGRIVVQGENEKLRQRCNEERQKEQGQRCGKPYPV